MTQDTLVLAHYYTIPEVQKLADAVGDSLELSLIAQRERPKRIVFLGVRFMAETAKIINPDAEVIIPTIGATCSLVKQTDIAALKEWRQKYHDHVHVSYINSSAEHKAISDWIVTSRNVDDIIGDLHSKGKKVIFSPDRNMGAYLNFTYGWNMPLWSAVCEVHDQFNLATLYKEMGRIARPHYLIAHPESPLSVLHMAKSMSDTGHGMVGSTTGMLKWVKDFSGPSNAVVWVATEEGVLYNMRTARPDVDVRQAPIYSGCKCNQCGFMKMNTQENAIRAIRDGTGDRIDYLSDDLMAKARVPIERMLAFSSQ